MESSNWSVCLLLLFGRVSVMQTLWMKNLYWGRGVALYHSGGAMPNTSVPSRSSLPSFLLPSQVHLFYTLFGMWFLDFKPHFKRLQKGLPKLDSMFVLQMFWCWWPQGWKQSLRVTSAHRRMTLWLPATSHRLSPCLAPPVGWRSLSPASV